MMGSKFMTISTQTLPDICYAPFRLIRYSTEDDEDDEEEDEASENAVDYKSGAYDFNVDMLSDGIAGMDLHGTYLTSDKDEDPYAVEDAGEFVCPTQSLSLSNHVDLLLPWPRRPASHAHKHHPCVQDLSGATRS